MTAGVVYLPQGSIPTAPASGSNGLYFDTAGVLCQESSDGVKHQIASKPVTGLTATGSNQSGALELTVAINEVTTVAASTGVKLSASWIAGDPPQVVYNAGVNVLTVYPPSGGKINSLSTNAGMTLATNTGIAFFLVSSTRWIGVLSA